MYVFQIAKLYEWSMFVADDGDWRGNKFVNLVVSMDFIDLLVL